MGAGSLGELNEKIFENDGAKDCLVSKFFIFGFLFLACLCVFCFWSTTHILDYLNYNLKVPMGITSENVAEKSVIIIVAVQHPNFLIFFIILCLLSNFSFSSKIIIYYSYSLVFFEWPMLCRYGVSRQVQDEFSVSSHAKAAKAQAENRFQSEIVPGVCFIKLIFT